MDLSPTTLDGQYVRLEPLTQAHAKALVSAAGDGALWNSTVTVVPSRDNVTEYVKAALDGQAMGRELPFVIIRKPNMGVVGTTRFATTSPASSPL